MEQSKDPEIYPATPVEPGPARPVVLSGEPLASEERPVALTSGEPLASEDVHVSRYEPDLMTEGEWEPQFPAKGSELDRVRWLAGLAQLGLNCRIEVVVNPQLFMLPGFTFRFYASRDSGAAPDSYFQLWLGVDYAAVASFLTGMSYGRTMFKRGTLG